MTSVTLLLAKGRDITRYCVIAIDCNKQYRLILRIITRYQDAGMKLELKHYIGSKVKAAREAQPKDKRLTQAKLAAKIGRATETVANIERGFALTGLETLQSISKELKVPLGYFFEGFEAERGKARGRIDREAKALNAIKQLTDAELRLVENMLEGLVSKR